MKKRLILTVQVSLYYYSKILLMCVHVCVLDFVEMQIEEDDEYENSMDHSKGNKRSKQLHSA